MHSPLQPVQPLATLHSNHPNESLSATLDLKYLPRDHPLLHRQCSEHRVHVRKEISSDLQSTFQLDQKRELRPPQHQYLHYQRAKAKDQRMSSDVKCQPQGRLKWQPPSINTANRHYPANRYQINIEYRIKEQFSRLGSYPPQPRNPTAVPSDLARQEVVARSQPRRYNYETIFQLGAKVRPHQQLRNLRVSAVRALRH